MKKNSQHLAARPAAARQRAPWRAASALVALMLMVSVSHGAETVISPVPLTTASAVQAKPNIMFILDGSGSMESSYMPDDAAAKSSEAYSYRASQCNGLAYDPTYDYTSNRPLQSDGATQYPNASTTATPIDGFNTSASAVVGSSSTSLTVGTGVKTIYLNSDLVGSDAGIPVRISSASNSSRWMQGMVTYWNSGSRPPRMVIDVTSSSGGGTYDDWTVTLLRTADLSGQYFYTYRGSATKMGWSYTTSGVVTTTDFYRQCASTVGNTPGRNVFDKVFVSSLTAAQLQNYVNWYAYFRTRIMLMRTAAGRAFATLNSNYRVGFTTIDSTGVTNDANFHEIGDFDSTRKTAFLSKLYGRAPNNYTPLRAALSKVGRYYANKVSGQTDPVQYSCQRNYAILSTDGYWNTDIESSSFGPLQLDGSSEVGQQDGLVSRPQYDGAIARSTVTKTWQRYQWSVDNRTGVNNCSGSTYSTVITLQSQTETIVTTNGAVTSDTFSAWSNGMSANRCYTTAELSSLGISRGNTYYSNSVDAFVSIANANGSGTLASTSDPVLSASGGSSSSLADVAQYYYTTDLRTSLLGTCSGTAVGGTQNNVCSNDVPASGLDTANWQHMTTSTIGLGVSGTLAYDPNYLMQSTGDYIALSQGTKNWPVPANNEEAENIDDLWHAAVNGRGRYFSALNASELVNAIASSLNSVTSVTGSASAAATNSLKPVSGDNNQAFIATYTTVDWTGDVKAYPLSETTGVVDTSRPAWSAQAGLDNVTASSRTIYYRRPAGALQSFTYGNLNTDGYGASFNNFCTQTNTPAQCSSLSDAQKTLANAGANLVTYLRGDKTYEASNTANPLYRTRVHALGDIVNGAPAYVGKPPFSYTDEGYTDFKTSRTGRKKMLYAGANDGMLHAFSADTAAGDAGTELWAYVPTAVLPKLYRLADSSYSTNHQYYVDAAPVVGDIKVGTAWKTILVGGLGAGGKSYYALDITDPTNPVALWEFSNANLGLSFGNPIITKRADGTWVVVVSSGYNNTAGDGRGHLFVLNANTGELLLDLGTTAGSTATPSGLAKLNAWVEDPTNNTALRFYGGDLLGNLWRFDTDNLVGATGTEATLLAQFLVNSTTPQPITTAPQPISVKSGSTNYPALIVGTGSYLGTDDVGSTTQQSIYAIKDALTDTGWGDVRQNAALVDRAITFATADATSGSIAGGTVDWVTKIGWKVDLPKSGERLVTEMVVQYNTLAAVSAIPGSSVCAPSGGSSWLYLLDVANGTASDSEPYASSALGNFLGVGITWLQTTGGDGKLEIVGSDGSITTRGTSGGAPSTSTIRRTSWRELVD
ncbi:hypothetical protein J7E62_21860 [Variovorax paradoxus]|nr:hypothetical protein [Variovorax paradoxus]